MSGYDLVIIHREVCPLGGGVFDRYITSKNGYVIYELDDAVWLPMPLKIDQRKHFFSENSIPRLMTECRMVVAGNQYIRDFALRYNSQVAVIPTPYDDLGGLQYKPKRKLVPVIVWIGNVGNDEYLDLLKSPLTRLASKYEFVFRIIGSTEYSGFQIEGVNVEFMEWDLNSEARWLLESDIGVMPLFDREYEKGKCAFKLIQYASAGMPLVASPVGMNREVIQHGVNGFLAETEEDWHSAIARLLEQPSLRSEMGSQAYATFSKKYTHSVNSVKWLNVFEEILNN
ncbi:MAG: glycosyltransferase family 4 protein [Gammaproteobacteria bacterium]|nr:glycosyltransferase family 4 protein [Pseudomonadales bacterium]